MEDGLRCAWFIKRMEQVCVKIRLIFAKRKEFENRDWIIFIQPTQSPATNSHDACTFPMMSKYVIKEQGFSYRSRLLKAGKLHKSVMKIWADERDLPVIAQSFSGYHQIVLAILDNKGDSNYLSEWRGISFGVRKWFMTSPEGDGVIMVSEPQRKGESIQEKIINHMIHQGQQHLRKQDSVNSKMIYSLVGWIMSRWKMTFLIKGMWWERKKRLVSMITNEIRTQD